MPQIVARGVFDQPPVEIKQVAAPGDDLQAGDPVAGQAIADDFDAAGIGGDVAADLAGAARGEIHRIVQAMVAGEILHDLGDDARLAGHAAIHRVEIQNPVQPFQRHHDLALAGHRRAAQSGTTAGGHQRQPMLIRVTHQLLHLLDAARQYHCQRIGRMKPGPVAAVSQSTVRIGAHMGRFDKGADAVEQSGGFTRRVQSHRLSLQG